MDKQWYDVHFTLRGFVMIEAVDKEQAEAALRDYMADRMEYLDKVSPFGLALTADASPHKVLSHSKEYIKQRRKAACLSD